MKASEFIAKLKKIATGYKTLYVMGCFGAPMTATNKTRYINNGASDGYNAKPARRAMIQAASADTFGFDCVCLIKGVLWGWSGDKNKIYGGAGYAINGVPDIGADTMITKCSGLSTDFFKLVPGEAVWMKGHIGVYIGDGLAVECTPSWDNKVQITACNCSKSGYNRRNWTKHGKLPYIEYDVQETTTSPEPEKPSTDVQGAFKVGDIVEFKGYKHYSTANASKGSSVKPCRAKVTQVYKTGKHPYHVRAVNSLGAFTSGVYGWVDAADLAPIGEIKAGDKVKVLNAVTYTGQKFKTYYDEYDVIQVNGDRAVIGIGKTVTAAINIKNIQLA